MTPEVHGCVALLVERSGPGNSPARRGRGRFTLPEALPAKMLFISAGSGITPIMSMLRSLDRRENSATSCTFTPPARDQVMFLSVLEDIAGRIRVCGWMCASPAIVAGPKPATWTGVSRLA